MIDKKCDENWVRTLHRIKMLKPFYYAVFSNLPKIGFDASNCDVMGKYASVTMAITGKELLYNKDYVGNAEVEELIFFSLHEIAHYALMHIDRAIRVKYPDIYNIAADLYTNALLQSEYKLRPNDVVKIDGIKIYMPLDKIIYDSNVNIEDFNVEDIYEQLLKYGMKLKSNDKDSSVQVGTKNKPIPKEENIIEQIKNANIDKELQQFLDKTLDLLTSASTDSNGKLTKVSGINDLYSDGFKQNLLSQIKSNVIRATVESKLAGTGKGSLLEEYVNKIIAPKIDWRKLVRKFLVQMTSKETSYNSVDKRTLWYDAILPGQSSPEDYQLTNVKMCTDTSGSISHEDLEVFYAQLAQLCNEYKVEGELIHWDSACEVMGDINEPKELYKIGSVYGRGGTDPSCLFEYFDSKKCKNKPAVIIILTDGYINFKEQTGWKKRYGKKTIWVINKCGNNRFNAPFGTVCNLATN